MSFSVYRQLDQMDCGPTCLRMVAKHYGRSFSLQTLREKSQINRDGVSLLGIAEAAENIGFRTMATQLPFEVLAQEVPLPCIVHWQQNHFVIVYEITGAGKSNQPAWLWGERRKTVRVADPAKGSVDYSVEEFCQNWATNSPNGNSNGIVLLLEPTPAFYQQEDEKTGALGLRQLGSYLIQYHRLIAQVLLGLLVSSGIQLIYPMLTQSLVDIGVNTGNLPFVYTLLAAMTFLLISRQIIEAIRGRIMLHISTRLNLSILSDFLNKLMRLPNSFFETKRLGDILQRIGDHQRIESLLTGQALTILFSFIDLLLLSCVLAYYHLTIFTIFMVGNIFYVGWVFLFMRQRRKIDFKSFELASKDHNKIVQMISGVQDIKLAGAERFFRWDWERLQARIFHLQVRTLSLGQFQQTGTFTILQGISLVILFMSAKAVIDGELTFGTMLAIQSITGQLSGPIGQLVGFAHSWQDAKISLERLNEIHTLEDEDPVERPKMNYLPEQRALELQQLSFSYPGMADRKVLNGINLTIPANKTTAIVGMSGSGKTTLLKLLLKFYEPTEGTIQVGESRLRDMSHEMWRSNCGVVMQEGFIFSDTIAANIALGEEHFDQSRLRNAMRAANIIDFVDALPLGYNTKIGAEGNGLSQGQKQRLLIARAIYKNPQFLFFDEATNALDANNEAAVMHALNDFFKGRTVVVVAHRLSTVKNADQIVVLDAGRIVEVGSHSQLIAQHGAYWKLVKNQLELDS
ncbi:peptidase domain-containing ABC transporter [Runella zeae]|uniref:peptidase domain-containing ABC transporter n=1 Tax=Runella zeae TaxID=94255 RepID=UPI00048E0799|nr:peptidase domain-containing ABC transporter [Runella zeae]